MAVDGILSLVVVLRTLEMPVAGGVPCVDSTFLYHKSGRRDRLAKTFLTYQQQLQILEQDKQLSIPNPDYAKQMLEEISYYSLIGGYKSLFKHNASNKFAHGVTFDELVSFYYFDEELRTLFLKYILHVERHMKSMFSYHFCEKYGEQQRYYLDVNCYNYNKKNQQQVRRLVHSLQKSISVPSQYAYINHSANTHHNIPLWVATNALTFGQISKMYQYATTDLRAKIKMYVLMANDSFHSVSMRQYQIPYCIKSCKSPGKTGIINMASRTCLLS